MAKPEATKSQEGSEALLERTIQSDVLVGAAVSRRHVHKGCSESELIYKLSVNFLMLYSEAEVPTVAGMNGKVTAYGKSGEF